jgi:hypothetical protein
LAQLVLALFGNDQFRKETHPVCDLAARAAEKCPHIATRGVPTANRGCGLSEWLARQGCEKQNGIEEIRLTDAVGTRDTRERPETDIDAIQILETIDLETS